MRSNLGRGGVYLPDTLEDFAEGFDAIYRLEEIDAKAVRKLRPLSLKTDLASAAPVDHTTGRQTLEIRRKFGDDDQPHFAWGHIGVKGLRSLKFQEPIGTLALSKHIESKLVESGFRFVGDLVEDRGTFRQLRSLTHFQAEEVHQALAQYFKSCPTGVVSEFENEHFIRILLASFDCRFAYTFLEQYQLQEIIGLSDSQCQEVRRWSQSQVNHARHTVREQLKKEPRQEWIDYTLKKTAGALILPWIEIRGGIATRREIQEWVDMHSQSAKVNGLMAQLLSDIWQWPEFLWQPSLQRVEASRVNDLFASNSHRLRDAEHLLRHIDQRFCRCGQIYPLTFLSHWISREWASCWRELDQSALMRLLNSCSNYRFERTDKEVFVKKIS